MIDWDASAELNECSVEWLKSWLDMYPQSHKYVVSICDECGKIRKLGFSYYAPMCHKCSLGTPEMIEQNRLRGIKRFNDPDECAAAAERTKQYFAAHPEARIDASEKSKMVWQDRPEIYDERNKNHSIEMKEYWADDHNRYIQSSTHKQYHINNPDAVERQSAVSQGQNYDVGEWTGYTDKSRPHLTPIHGCININEPFSGCEGHHILKDVVVYIPKELHKHIKHNIKTGYNMGEINMLAIQFVNGGLEL